MEEYWVELKFYDGFEVRIYSPNKENLDSLMEAIKGGMRE